MSETIWILLVPYTLVLVAILANIRKSVSRYWFAVLLYIIAFISIGVVNETGDGADLVETLILAVMFIFSIFIFLFFKCVSCWKRMPIGIEFGPHTGAWAFPTKEGLCSQCLENAKSAVSP